jgi:hypothetical protein
MQLFKQLTNKYTPEQMNNLFNRAQQMGVPKEVLDNLKKDINTK